MKFNNIPNKRAPGEENYKKLWSVFGKRVEPYSYRLFSRYIKDPKQRIFIVPENLGHSFIDSTLNPPTFSAFYSDKNSYNLYLKGIKSLPRTILRKMNGSMILDESYNPIPNINTGKINEMCSPYRAIILKPSINSCSGIGVQLFKKADNIFRSSDGIILTLEYLLSFGDDFILQECIIQDNYLAQFNASSVNTLRIFVYCSIEDESINITSSLLRIGQEGAVVDNAHAGGKFVGVDPKSGKLNSYLCDQNGIRYNIHNGIEFNNKSFRIPNWETVIEEVKNISKLIKYHRYIAFDMAIDEQGLPKLIEFNVGDTGFWLSMFSGQICFGNHTLEIIDYCSKRNIDGKV